VGAVVLVWHNGVPSRNGRPADIKRRAVGVFCCAQCYIVSACSNRFASTAMANYMPLDSSPAHLSGIWGGAGGSYTRPRPRIWDMGKCMALLMHLNCCNFRPTGPFGISLRAGCVIHGAVGLIPHCHSTGRHERYTAPAGVWPASGPEAAGTSAASVREIAVERLTFDRSDQHISNQP
jgi:hypothetical protein